MLLRTLASIRTFEFAQHSGRVGHFPRFIPRLSSLLSTHDARLSPLADDGRFARLRREALAESAEIITSPHSCARAYTHAFLTHSAAVRARVPQSPY
jgi:hypothetical protein